MKFTRFVSILSLSLLAASAKSDSLISKASKSESSKGSTIVYLLRHAEETRTIKVLGEATTAYNVEWDGNAANITSTDGSTAGSNYNEACGDRNCAEELSSLGLLRADVLGRWFHSNGILSDITHIFSSSKRRTKQTVQPAATLAGISVQPFPTDGTELNPQGAGSTTCPTINAIKNAQHGSKILVASHTSAIYQILGSGVEGECTGFGIDTSDVQTFPVDDRGAVPKEEYGFVWIFSIDEAGNGTFLKRIAFELDLTTIA
jgi:phosphohistidine phosphatase SixA